MGFYDTEKGVNEYIKLAEGYNGAELIEWLSAHLKEGSSVLELGMGPGVDLKLLQKRHLATGSDHSKLFVERYLKLDPEADVMQLDAVTMDTTRRFDAIFSNKVLQHLSKDQVRRSLAAQHAVLNEGGLAMHALWYGEGYEEHAGLGFQQYTEEALKELLDGSFKILETRRYSEMAEGDSIAVFLKKK